MLAAFEQAEISEIESKATMQLSADPRVPPTVQELDIYHYAVTRP